MLTDLERTVMEMLLAGDDPELRLLRDQYAAASVTSRDTDSAGFFTTFSVDISLPSVSRPLRLSDVGAEVVGTDAVGFILWVEDGFIRTLEGWSVGDWPGPDASLARAYYLRRVAPDSPTVVETPTRDLVFALHDPYRTIAERQLEEKSGSASREDANDHWWARAIRRMRPPDG